MSFRQANSLVCTAVCNLHFSPVLRASWFRLDMPPISSYGFLRWQLMHGSYAMLDHCKVALELLLTLRQCPEGSAHGGFIFFLPSLPSAPIGVARASPLLYPYVLLLLTPSYSYEISMGFKVNKTW